MENFFVQIDANFGQKPFLFDMRSELKMAEKATMDNINAIEIPAEKVLWMNRFLFLIKKR